MMADGVEIPVEIPVESRNLRRTMVTDASFGPAAADRVFPAGFREVGWTLAAAVFVVLLAMTIILMVWHRGDHFWHDDFQSQLLPTYMEMDRAIREGEFPLLSTSVWFGGDLVGEYVYGTFNIVHLLLILLVFRLKLGLEATAVVLVLAYLAILAAGTFRLARRLGLAVPYAMVVVLAAALNGWLFHWGARTWFPAMASFAWIPWLWWSLERAFCDRYGLVAQRS